ncbi:MAG TPA: DUF58 domain-containing protein [Acidimicrobiales bacterium]|nr:DUF58 domain-containing protein [Acidimicrobiales bacterium]
MLLLWAAVARQSGSGWVQAVGAVVAAVVILGLVAPAGAAATLRVAVESSPGDATAGGEVRITVSANRTTRVTPVEPPGAAVITPARRPGEVVLVPARRGVLSAVVVDAASAWPFGLLWWARRLVVELPRPLYVAPRAGAADPAEEVQAMRGAETGSPVPARSGELRGTRAYHPGDDRRRVHWPVSAHAGKLMVSEHEEGGRRSPLRIRAELPDDEAAAEERAGRVLGSILSLLESGRSVVLETWEAGRGEVVGPVGDARQAGRRLALAVSPSRATRQGEQPRGGAP